MSRKVYEDSHMLMKETHKGKSVLNVFNVTVPGTREGLWRVRVCLNGWRCERRDVSGSLSLRANVARSLASRQGLVVMRCGLRRRP